MSKKALLIAVVAALSCGVIILFLRHAVLKVRLAFAEDQITICYEAKDQALKAPDLTNAVGFLEYAVDYYPSGTKQATGSRLDRIVEMVRSNCVNDIIADLRRRTGKDYGNNPTNWYQHYPPPRP